MSKVLYIGLDYYHYPSVLKNEMEALGYQVDYYPIEPRTYFYKITRYLAPRVYRKALDTYHRTIIQKSQDEHYDKVFFITSHFFSLSNLGRLKSQQCEAEFIAYHWDSIEQYDYLNTVDYFDKVYSFDRDDCNKYGLKYLPLFASGVYKQNMNDGNTIDLYTVSSVVRPERYMLANKIRKFCIDNGISYFFHLKVTPVTYLRLLIKGILPEGVTFKTMKSQDMANLVNNSSTALDVTNHKQSGLTMRVIENIYAGKKVITTNSRIKEESFYNAEQILVLEEQSLELITEFLNIDIATQSYPELSIKSWVSEVLS